MVGKRSAYKNFKKDRKGQSVLEYFFVYVWALLLALIVIILLYIFVFAPSAIAPNSCSFVYGAYCQDMILGSNSISSKVALFLTNTQQYPIVNPQVSLNISNIGIVNGKCLPSYVLPGGAIICNVTLPTTAISTGTLVSGKLYLSAIPCPSGNVTTCTSEQRQTYTGNFNYHASPLLAGTTLSISISATNSTTAIGIPDPVTATVKLLGYPISGATVNFTASNVTTGAKLQYISLNPSIATTDSNGNVTSFVSTNTPGFAKITASFAGVSKSVIINFSTPIYVTFTTNQKISINQPVLVIDKIIYLPSQLPITFAWTKNSKHNYNFLDLQSTNAERYIFSSVSGCNLANKAGQIIATSNCTAVGNYKKQYFLSTSVNPPQAGSVTLSPPGNWYDSGASVGIAAHARGSYTFSGWVGTGTGSYTGASAEATVLMNSPITEQANFYPTNPPPANVKVTFEVNTTCYYPTAPMVYVDHIGYPCQGNSTLIHTFTWSVGTKHNYSFNSTVYTTNNYQRFFYSHVSGCGLTNQSGTITANSNCTVTGYYSTQYLLSMATSPSGAGTVSPGTEWLNPGTSVTINETPNQYYNFSGWVGQGIGSYSSTSPSATITVGSPVIETANYTYYPPIEQIPTYKLYFKVNTTNSSVVSYYNNNNCKAHWYWDYNCWGDTAPLTESAGSSGGIHADIPIGWQFVSWTGTGNGSTTGTSNNWPIVTLNSNITETLNLKQVPTYNLYLKVNTTNSSVVSYYNNNNCEAWWNYNCWGDTAPYTGDAGSIGDIYAIIPIGWQFVSWTGTGNGSYTGTSNNWDNRPTVTLNSNITETLNLKQVPTYNLYLKVNTTNSSVISYYNHCNAIYNVWYNNGGNSGDFCWRDNTPYTGDAGSSGGINASIPTGWQFVSWTGTGNGNYTGTSNNWPPVTLNSNITETLNLKHVSAYSITFAFNPSPSVNSSVCSTSQSIVEINGVNYTCSQLPKTFKVSPGTFISFSYYPSVYTSYPVRFVYSLASGCGGVYSQSGTITANSNCTVTGYYSTQYLLSMATSPSGAGTVSPGTEWLNPGTSITINETPNSGYTFNYWVGRGSGSYSGNSPSATITLNGPIVETANYST